VTIQTQSFSVLGAQEWSGSWWTRQANSSPDVDT
jgi:hypothetical protein